MHYPAYSKLAETYEIVAVCDPDQGKLSKWRGRLGLSPQDLHTGWEAIVARDDVDVYDIMVPIELNYAVTEAVAKRLSGKRKAIICEKPLAGSFK
ncbi:MAG TPA: oxidoreductase, partial [Firmicutes bacterium]|nr:oxidoreductase [Bacillota bacterium]